MDNNCFGKKSRLLTAKDFSLVFAANRIKSKKVSNQHFFILARSNELENSRIGFALSKKKIKQAVCRNRIKRVVREQFRLLNKEGVHLDLVIMANSACVHASKQELAKSFQHLWQKLQKHCRQS